MKNKLLTLVLSSIIATPVLSAPSTADQLDSAVCEYYGTMTLLALEYKRRGMPFTGLMEYMTAERIDVVGYEVLSLTASTYSTDIVYYQGQELTVDDNIEQTVVNLCLINR